MLTLNIELANVTVKTMRPMETVIPHLRLGVQFFGLPGSLGPSNSTKKRSVCSGGIVLSKPFSRPSKTSSSLFLELSSVTSSVCSGDVRGCADGGVDRGSMLWSVVILEEALRSVIHRLGYGDGEWGICRILHVGLVDMSLFPGFGRI